jgi:hypothetical protein
MKAWCLVVLGLLAVCGVGCGNEEACSDAKNYMCTYITGQACNPATMDNARAKVVEECGQDDYDQFANDLAAACTAAVAAGSPLACNY